MTDSENAQTIRSEGIEEMAALWIHRRDHSSWSIQDQVELDAWLARSMTHSIAFWRLNAAWKRTERLAALKPTPSRTAGLFSSERIKSVFARMAAILIIAASVSAGAVYLMQPTQSNYSTPVGGHKKVTLADGSQIELNTDTMLRISTGADQRKVWLDRGEAYFRIKHSRTHLFVVMVAGHRITDLGTEFSIRKDTQRIEIALTEGSAKFESLGASGTYHQATLKPGDVAIATGDSISVTKVPKHILDNQLGWRRGVLIFNSTTLADAAAQFNRYSQRKLIVVGTASQLKVDGTFAATDTAAFAAISKHILHLKTDQIGGEIVISR